MGARPEPAGNGWPELSYPAWRETCATLHLWTQVVGKVRLVQTPWLNHSWHVTLYVSPRGLSTGLIPHGSRAFRIEFDFIDHRLHIDCSDGGQAQLALAPMSVAQFYHAVMETLAGLGLPVAIHTLANEIPTTLRFPDDRAPRPYDGEYAWRFWQALLQIDRVFHQFRARFRGKCSPVHFFWGSFDLAVTRFSGRPAPVHPGGVPNLPDWITREAYSHEVSSAGFWPGGEALPEAVFYAYAYPAPEGFGRAPVRPAQARYHEGLREFVLPYEVVRRSSEPDRVLLEFLQSTYEAAANGAGWDRPALERV